MKSSTSDITPTGKILCVGGCPRKGGNTDYMLEFFVKSIPGPVQTETIMLRDYDFSPCIGCERCRKASMTVILSRVRQVWLLIHPAG